MSELKLVLKKQWYGMVESGEKKEEYRDITAYWCKRFANILGRRDPETGVFYPLFGSVTFYLGYAKNRPSMTYEMVSIRIGEGRQEWGAIPGKKYFIIELGQRVK